MPFGLIQSGKDFMRMFRADIWSKTVITDIAAAVHVMPANRRDVHKNRPFHGLVLNEANGERDYYFSDGTVMRTEGNQLFYLPKGSSYRVVPVENALPNNCCYAINFYADISDEPFAMSFRDPEPIIKAFREAAYEWRRQGEFSHMAVRKILYEIILAAAEEQAKRYTPSATERLIAPAIERMNSSFTDNGLSVSALARDCGITESYFRRIFTEKFGISPKEYLIRLRIGYAKDLLSVGGISVSEAAAICGYAEPTHFSREFSKRVGVSPVTFKLGLK